MTAMVSPLTFCIRDPASGFHNAVEVIVDYAEMGCQLKIFTVDEHLAVFLRPQQMDALVQCLEAARKFV